MKFTRSILTSLLASVSLQGGDARAEMRLARVIGKSDGTTVLKIPNAANDRTAIAAIISGGDAISCVG